MAKRILLVDDEPLIVKGLKFALESDGYETDSAGDGEQALEKIQNGNFDLILLDVMLPKMSGIEVCQAVREKSDVPIIMLTAKGEDMDKILGLEYGADDYMTKHSVTAKQRHIVGGGVVVIVVQAVGFYKVGVVHTDFGGLGVH